MNILPIRPPQTFNTPKIQQNARKFNQPKLNSQSDTVTFGMSHRRQELAGEHYEELMSDVLVHGDLRPNNADNPPSKYCSYHIGDYVRVKGSVLAEGSLMTGKNFMADFVISPETVEFGSSARVDKVVANTIKTGRGFAADDIVSYHKVDLSHGVTKLNSITFIKNKENKLLNDEPCKLILPPKTKIHEENIKVHLSDIPSLTIVIRDKIADVLDNFKFIDMATQKIIDPHNAPNISVKSIGEYIADECLKIRMK